MPTQTPSDVETTLRRVLNDEQITITPLQRPDLVESPPSPLRPDVTEAAKAVTSAMWPGVPVVPFISQGATDGTYLRRAGIPTYGISGIGENSDDVRAHGKDERISPTSLYEGREFMYRLVKKLSAAPR
jgi:acetylornithine deacetylase/succinyl-diaminopimelate desuccinylase-like protein